MKVLIHQTAKASHYNKESESYDAFNEARSAVINFTVEQILKKYNAKTVLDLTCGTGSQVFWLAQRGFTVTGSDINAKMLKIARDKAKKEKLDLQFINGDMRTVHAGEFDAVITIFNAIGHLTKLDFEKAIRNIHSNLKDDGLYLFDINNLSYLLKDDRITELTIDWLKITDDIQIRDIQYSTINKDGILASYTTSIIQKDSGKPKVTKSAQTLQIYTANQLKELLHKNGFKVIEQCSIDGSKFVEDKTDRILTIARKQ